MPEAPRGYGPVTFPHFHFESPMLPKPTSVPLSAQRCACPINRGDARGRTFSVNLDDNVYQCFDATCQSKGDVINLWAAVRGLSLRAAALDLVQTFGLEPTPRHGTEKRNG